MKIKQDFITNSSSTSFTLRVSITSEIELLDKFEKFDVKKLKLKNFKFENLKEYSNSVFFDLALKEKEYDDEDEVGMLKYISGCLEVGNTCHPDTDELIELIYVNILLRYFCCCYSPNTEEDLITIFKKIIKSIGGKVRYPFGILFTQTPDAEGDGYGGDPQGLYTSYKELFLGEAKVGRIIFINERESPIIETSKIGG
jgi:hypothetical protein